jgi:arginase family enzyme
MTFSKNKVVVFGCSLDADEREEAVREKLAFSGAGGEEGDPYLQIIELLHREIPSDLWQEGGSLPIPGWLAPFPPQKDREQVSVQNFVAFIDQDGCRDYARQVGDFIADTIHPALPCLIAVDHSLTGGACRKLKELYQGQNLSLLVLDSHTDALPVPLISGAIQYDIETNPKSFFDKNDPFLYGRPDSYNASSFLNHLLEEGVLIPENLYILGISDYPPKHAFRLKDPRIQNYVQHYAELKRKGVTLVSKEDILLAPSKVRSILKAIKTPYLYLSIDLDIGAGSALSGVRFLDRQGLNEGQLYRLVKSIIKEVLSRGIKLAGLDFSEFNPRQAGQKIGGGEDPTYRIAANLIKDLLPTIARV